jgi:hypothetical protein
MEANIYYGEEKYQRMVVKATEESEGAGKDNKKPKLESHAVPDFEDLQDGNH